MSSAAQNAAPGPAPGGRPAGLAPRPGRVGVTAGKGGQWGSFLCEDQSLPSQDKVRYLLRELEASTGNAAVLVSRIPRLQQSDLKMPRAPRGPGVAWQSGACRLAEELSPQTPTP